MKSISRKAGWNFNWKLEFINKSKETFKLLVRNDAKTIQGLLCVSYEFDHVYMPLLESAPENTGVNKVYQGVAGNLVAYACKLSFEKGFNGFVSFTAKTKLIGHYEKTLGAFKLSGQRMIIATVPAQFLVDKYFNQ